MNAATSGQQKAQERRTLLRMAAIQATEDLHGVLADAHAWLAEHTVTASVAVVPITRATDIEVADMEAIALYEGDEMARVETRRGLTAIEYADEQHPKTTLRRPGVVVVDDADEMAMMVGRVNEAKRVLQDAMKAMGYPMWQYWHKRLPQWRRLNRKQAYRHWYMPAVPVQQINFSWATRLRGCRQIRVAELREDLHMEQADTGHPDIEIELERLGALHPDEVITERRPIAPVPVANIKSVYGTRQSTKVSIPIITAHPVARVRLLPQRSEVTRQQRNDQHTEPEPLIERLNVYRYTRAHRYRLPEPYETRHLSVVAGELVAQCKRATWRGAPHDRVAQCLATACGLRGQAEPPWPLDNDRRVRLLAATSKNVFFDAREAGEGVWRVSQDDAAACAEKLSA